MTNRIFTHVFGPITADTAPFVIRGGLYGISVHAATFGTVTLQRLANDGVTWVTVQAAFTADGYATVYLISGTYKVAVATATGVFVEVVSIAQAV
jgi:hypothetical protein